MGITSSNFEWTTRSVRQFAISLVQLSICHLLCFVFTLPAQGEEQSASCTGPVMSRGEGENQRHRAGHPECIAHYAHNAAAGKYSGGYVGGGTQMRGEARVSDEGTWGRDYCGLLPRRPWLRWSH